MALITDPDSLNDQATDTGTTEVFINTTNKTVDLHQTGNLSTDGVTEKALYSFLKEEWKNDPHSKNLAAYPFPMVPITDEFYEWIDGWDYEQDTARQLVWQGGWSVKSTAATANPAQIWANINTGTGAEANDQLYYNQISGTPGTDNTANFTLTGPIDEAIQVLSDPNEDGAFGDGYDRRTFIEVYLREQAQLYDKATLDDLPDTTLANPKAYGLQVSTGTDPKVTESDANIDANTPYTGMTLTSYASAQSKNISGNNYDFGWVIDGNGGTLEQIYEWFQRQLRKSTDIDSDVTGAYIGKIADEGLEFIGDTLYTRAMANSQAGGTGVFIENFAAADINRVFFTDNTGTLRNYDFTAVLTLNFNSNLVDDTDAYYWVYHTTLGGRASASFSDAAITSGQNILTSATATFTATDVGLTVRVAGAGAAGADLVTTISGFTNSTTVTLTANAGTTVSGANLDIYGDDWGEGSAFIVQNDTPADMAGAITVASIAQNFDYDNNTDGGRTAGTDAPVTVVAIGFNTGQYVRATGTIERSTTNTVSVTAPLERNYSNPV